MKVVRTRQGARLVHAGHVVSEVVGTPGPTQNIFDVLAACAFLGPEGPVALLGFAGGGLLAPLRALGDCATIEAVDLSTHGQGLFRKYVKPWSGAVRFHQGEAGQWLGARDDSFAVVIEDLSVQVPGDIFKPEVSFNVLPPLISRALKPGGWAIVNALPTPGRKWDAAKKQLVAPYKQARVLTLAEYENEILVAADALPSADALGRHVRMALALIGSKLERGLKAKAL